MSTPNGTDDRLTPDEANTLYAAIMGRELSDTPDGMDRRVSMVRVLERTVGGGPFRDRADFSRRVLAYIGVVAATGASPHSGRASHQKQASQTTKNGITD